MSAIKKEVKTGIIYILIGILIPLIALPFVTGFSKDKSFFDNLYTPGIEILKSDPQSIITSSKKDEKSKDDTFKFSKLIPQKIPFRIFLALMVVFLYLGIIKIDSSRRNRNVKQNEDVTQ